MTSDEGRALIPPEQLDGAITVLETVRADLARTRPEIVRTTGLGRNLVTQRVTQLLECGLLAEGMLGPSTGGRAPRELRFNARAGHVLVAELGATGTAVGLADLAGTIIARHEEPAEVVRGPEPVLARVDELFRELLERQAETPEIWGIGIGLPGPVEFQTGRPVAPPIMPGWDGFPVREYFVERYHASTWVDNDVNVMALGELRGGLAQGERDVIYVKVGTGIGAGLVSGGRLHRGAQGCAGDIGHIAVADDTGVLCRCGRFDCLEALAGGYAVARDARAAVAQGRSDYLAQVVELGREIEASDVTMAASHGDQVSVDLLQRSATLVGEALARLVNFFNPAVILIGGGVAEAGDAYLATVRQVVFSRSLPLATRSLRLIRSPIGQQAGLRGAAFMVVDELLSRRRLGIWIEHGSPRGLPQLSG